MLLPVPLPDRHLTHCTNIHPGETWAAVRAFMRDQALYLFTISGFPYGDFHGRPVEERVYLPGWLVAAVAREIAWTRERLAVPLGRPWVGRRDVVDRMPRRAERGQRGPQLLRAHEHARLAEGERAD